jgi:hypothetical protein
MDKEIEDLINKTKDPLAREIGHTIASVFEKQERQLLEGIKPEYTDEEILVMKALFPIVVIETKEKSKD